MKSTLREGFPTFITLEGIEGSGKSTQLKKLSKELMVLGLSVLETREPGGTRLGEEIRSLVLGTNFQEMTPLAELLLIGACRAQHVQELIRPALEMGMVVLCDRFSDATLAYQGYGRGLSLEDVRRVNEISSCGLAPGLTILLDCPVELGLNRSRGRLMREGKSKSEGRFESLDTAFHERVREAYLRMAREDARRFRIIDASRPLELVSKDVLNCVRQHLGV